MTWGEPSSANGEIINYNIDLNDGATVRESSGMGTEFVVSGLLPYTDYSVRVQACTSEGCGPFSNELSSTTLQEGERYIRCECGIPAHQGITNLFHPQPQLLQERSLLSPSHLIQSE